MAHIKYRFREGYCDAGEEWCDGCGSDNAEYMDCPKLQVEKPYPVIRNGQKMMAIPYGDCVHSRYKTIHGEKTVKKYEIEIDDDDEIVYFEMSHTKFYKPEDILFLEIDGKVIVGEKNPEIYEKPESPKY